mmetsp:Transcript_16866/g.38419  ORF Transcript_16866/g.38419 Transcript_16866/m.38419 type:complete len:308 (-) Transcript_16866:751-1674(-)
MTSLQPLQQRLWLVLHNSIVHFTCPFCHIMPRIHLLDVGVKFRWDNFFDILADGNFQHLDQRVGIRRRVLDHIRRHHLGHSTDPRAHNQKSAACRLQDGNAECLCERAVHVDVSSYEHVSDVGVLDMPEHLNPILQLMILPHLLQRNSHGPIPANHKVHMLKLLADGWDDLHHEINPLAIHKPRYAHDGDAVTFPCCRVGSEDRCVHGVGDDRNVRGIDACTQHRVLLAGVGNADDVVDAGEGEVEDFVHVDRRGVREAEERVVGEDHFQSHGARVHQIFMADDAERLVPMHYRHALADADEAEDWP